MPASDPTFNNRLAELKQKLVEQGRAVQLQIERAIESVFEKDRERARGAVDGDRDIDLRDVQIEREAVQLLYDAMDKGVRMDHHAVRTVLTIVKVNNEFERIADCAVNIAERIESFMGLDTALPPKFRVIANSVVGIMAATNTAFATMDVAAAQLVLSTDDATEAFKDAILKDTESQLARGEHTVDYAISLRLVAVNLARMSDHCTNVAEQVIYVESGKIVRHMGDHWTKPAPVEEI